MNRSALIWLAIALPALSYGRMLDIPARQQWRANYGYCGEVSLIGAGLYYGQFTSQFEARRLAEPLLPQNREDSQVLLGVNARRAATRMGLTAEEWHGSTERGLPELLAWARAMLERGYPVAIGVYMNQRLFYGKRNPSAGDSEYDHIVTVTGLDDETLTFTDHGLWAPEGEPTPYVFHYPVHSLARTRAGANRAREVYSLSRDGRNLYALALTGVRDTGHATLPVRVTTDRSEEPDLEDGATEPPRGTPVRLTVTVSGLRPGKRYKLYRYDRFARVPRSRFNALAARAAKQWDIRVAKGSRFRLRETLDSGATAIYRAVPATAP
jgi:hypothetical protein